MAGYITEVTVYSSVLFNRTGVVRRWANRVEAHFTAAAIREAPINRRMNKSHQSFHAVGALKASIIGDVQRLGPNIIETTISVDVPYALFVLRGTGPTIEPASAPYMKVPANPGFGTRVRQYHVRGQMPNNFLARASVSVARTHPSIRPFAEETFRPTPGTNPLTF